MGLCMEVGRCREIGIFGEKVEQFLLGIESSRITTILEKNQSQWHLLREKMYRGKSQICEFYIWGVKILTFDRFTKKKHTLCVLEARLLQEFADISNLTWLLQILSFCGVYNMGMSFERRENEFFWAMWGENALFWHFLKILWEKRTTRRQFKKWQSWPRGTTKSILMDFAKNV